MPRQPSDEKSIGITRLPCKPQKNTADHEDYVHIKHPAETVDINEKPGTSCIYVPVEEPCDNEVESGLVDRHNVHPNEKRIHVPYVDISLQ